MKTLVHYAQLMNNNKFQPFDYGPGLTGLGLTICETVNSVLSAAEALTNNGLTSTFASLGIPTNISGILPTWLVQKICGGNKLIYGSSTVPKYNLSLVTAPVVLYAGPNDALAAPSVRLYQTTCMQFNIGVEK